jgi:hypothetical protein
MNKKEAILKKYPDEEFIFPDGFDNAIIGVDEDNNVIVYSSNKAIDIIFNETEISESDLTESDKEDGRTLDDIRMEMALEHFHYNVKGSKGHGFPIWIDDDF